MFFFPICFIGIHIHNIRESVDTINSKRREGTRKYKFKNMLLDLLSFSAIPIYHVLSSGRS